MARSMAQATSDDRPVWARRIRAERVARGWSQADAVRVMQTQAAGRIASHATALRNWKRWESGEAEPDLFHKPLLARVFGLPVATLFPRPIRRETAAALLADTGMDALEAVTRLRATDVSGSVLDAARIAVDQLCTDYSTVPADTLHVEGLAWLRRLTPLLDGRLTLAQHREILAIAGQVALLLGCVEHDMGDSRAAEATRRGALGLGRDAGHHGIVGWAFEMRAWFALTRRDYRNAIATARAGIEHAAAGRDVAVQLAAHTAKAWARLGDRREVERALDHGRRLLDALPFPDNPQHHFVVDPAKFDFYTMDCYRLLGEDALAAAHADEVLRSSTDRDGTDRDPMRTAEARVTLGVVAARAGDLNGAMALGRAAISGVRRSLPSLALHVQEFGDELAVRYPRDGRVSQYRDELREITGGGDHRRW